MDDFKRDPHLPLTPADIAMARALGKPLPEDDGSSITDICNRDWEARMERMRTGTRNPRTQYLASVEAAIGSEKLAELSEKYGETPQGTPCYFEDDREFLKDLADRIFFGQPMDGADTDRLREIAFDSNGLSVRPMEVEEE